jgi:hypothetical protein
VRLRFALAMSTLRRENEARVDEVLPTVARHSGRSHEHFCSGMIDFHGGTFCNLEHVASPTLALHHQFLMALSIRPDDGDLSNKVLDLETQLAWLRAIDFVDVDCHWKWRELALLAGTKPNPNVGVGEPLANALSQRSRWLESRTLHQTLCGSEVCLRCTWTGNLAIR